MKKKSNSLFIPPKLMMIIVNSFWILIITTEMHGQLIAPTMMQYKSPKSPSVDRLQSFLEVPTNLNTGQLAMNVPLYEIKLGGLTVPITLDYANTGLKVQEIPSWAGLGWNLIAGGMITRTVRGLPDDVPNAGIMYQYQRVASCLDNTISYTNRYQFYREIVDGEVDSQFDEYMFTFLGRTGKFYINKNGIAVGLPKNNLKITFANNSGIQSFTIIDESGVSFLFNIRAQSVSVNSDENLFGKGYYNWQTGVTWYLTKIILPNTEEVLLEYNSQGLTYHQYTESLALDRTEWKCQPSALMSAYQLALFDVSTPDYQLKKITWPLGHVDFVAGPFRQDLKQLNPQINSPSLSSIEVYDYDNALKKKINFQMIQGNRLLLKSVNFLDVVTSEVESRYHFNYYNESSVWPSLSTSTLDKNAQDIWGYYNGAQQYSLLPYFSVGSYLPKGTYSFGGYGQSVDRSPRGNFAVYGMLKEVIYPTGGKSVFEYEPNTATYPNYNSIPELLKNFVETVYETISADEVITDGISMTNSYNTESFTLASDVERARILTIETTNDQSGFANTSSAITSYPGTEDPNDCNCGNVTTTTNPYSHTYKREYYMDLPAGSYQTGVAASSYDGFTARAFISIEIPVAQSFTVQIGGMRLKKTYFNDGVSGDQMVKRYLYDFEDEDQVNIKHFPTFVNTITMSVIDGTCWPCNLPMATLHSLSVTPIPGYHLEYPKVIELSGEDGEMGRTVHNFSNTPYIGGFTSKPYADPAVLNWYGGLEYKQEIQKFVSPSSYTTVKEDNKSFIGENFSNYNSFDMSLKIAVRELNYCAGYPAILFPVSENAASTLVSTAFAAEFVPVYTEIYNLQNTTSIDYFDPSSNQITNATHADYAAVNKLLPSATQSVGSKGETVKTIYKYVQDYTIPTGVTLSDEVKGIQLLTTKNMLSSPIEQLSVIKNPGGVEMITSGELFEYYPNSPIVKAKYILAMKAPIAVSAFQYSVVTSSGSLTKDPHYVLDYEVTTYDAFQNPSEIHPADGLFRSVLWGYAHSRPVCEVTNAPSSKIAYTSFETSEQGNFQYTGAITSSPSVTGKKYYNLTTANPVTAQVSDNQEYIITYWSKLNNGYSISGTSALSHQEGRSFSGWYYHEHRVTTQGTTLSISGNGALDEVRLYPVGSQITTFTYDPLYGITTKSNANGMVTYYEYDGSGRLDIVRDQDNNIIKKYSYEYANIDVSDPESFPDWQATGITRCIPCSQDVNHSSNLSQVQKVDMNPLSYSYNDTTWEDAGISSTCGVADWQFYYSSCQSISGFNTGYQIQTEKDRNPCSPTANQTRESLVQDTTACPPASVPLIIDNQTSHRFVVFFTGAILYNNYSIIEGPNRYLNKVMYDGQYDIRVYIFNPVIDEQYEIELNGQSQQLSTSVTANVIFVDYPNVTLVNGQTTEVKIKKL